jgi:P pilus assembly chaperone PapD
MNLIPLLAIFLNGFLGYTVSPVRVDKQIFSAAEITETVEVQNVSRDTLRIKVEFEDFEIDRNGTVKFMPSSTLKNSVAAYMAVNPEEFFIPPESRENVRITFRPPAENKDPEYYGMAIFKSQPIPSQYQPMIKIAGEIGIPIYYSVSRLVVKDAAFDSLYVTRDTVNILFRNAGNIHLRVRGISHILVNNDRAVATDSIREFVVMPGQDRKVKLPIKPALEPGSYTLKVQLDYGAVELMEGETNFKK